MPKRNISARMRSQLKAANAQKAANAARRQTHPGNDSKLTCVTHRGAKLVRVDGVMTFVPGRLTTYEERRSNLTHPGGKPTGAMPSVNSGSWVSVPAKPEVTQRVNASLRGFDKAVVASSGDVVGGSAKSSIRAQAPRSFTGQNDHGRSAGTAERMQDHVSSQFAKLHHK